MPEVRITGQSQPRSTSIPRTTTQVAHPNGGGTSHSHVTASPGAGHRVQAQVQAVRGAQAIRNNAPMKLDAGPVAGPPPAAAAQQTPVVQFIARQGIAGAGAGVASPFNAEQLMLLATLTDNFREHSAAIGDALNAQFAEGVLGILATLAAAVPVGPTAASAPVGAQEHR